jgi:membrane protein implicated in regulation of membrane protease activity
MHHILLFLLVFALLLFFIFPWPVALLWFVVGTSATVAVFLVLSKVQRPRRIGEPSCGMIGSKASVIEARGNEAEVRWQGEIWHAVSTQPLNPGSEVIIEGVDGLILQVRNQAS